MASSEVEVTVTIEPEEARKLVAEVFELRERLKEAEDRAAQAEVITWRRNCRRHGDAMKLPKLVEPFSSFSCQGSLRERWSQALRDPGYWMLWAVLAFIVIGITWLTTW